MKVNTYLKWLIPCIIIIGIYFVLHSKNSTRFIDQVQHYQDSIKLDKKTPFYKIDTSTFNLKYYMHLFNKIHLDPRLEYDYVFLDNIFDGRPYIFVREHSFNMNKFLKQEAAKALRTSSRTRICKIGIHGIVHSKKFSFQKDSVFTESAKERVVFDKDEYCGYMHRRLSQFLRDSINMAFNHVVPEDSEEGYVQYLFFHEMGEQFALKWHEAYNQKSVIATTSDINKIIKEYTNNTRFECNQKELKKISNIDPTPSIKLDRNQCIITWYEIETHRGIFKRTYSISRTFPYRVQHLGKTCLVDINMTFFY